MQIAIPQLNYKTGDIQEIAPKLLLLYKKHNNPMQN